MEIGIFLNDIQIIGDTQKSVKEKNCEILERAIKEVLDKPMSVEENIAWKLSIKDVLIYFLEKDKKVKDDGDKEIVKNDRVLSVRKFEDCIKQAGLPYKMTMKRKDAKRE